jgi:hypothetical protein
LHGDIVALARIGEGDDGLLIQIHPMGKDRHWHGRAIIGAEAAAARHHRREQRLADAAHHGFEPGDALFGEERASARR